MKVLALLSALVIIFGCSKKDAPSSGSLLTIPIAVTGPATSVASDSAFTISQVSADGGAAVTARGICWGTIANPDTTFSHTSNGTGVGIFTSKLTGLTPSTTYYFKAYAVNSQGVAYGMQMSFVTMP